MSPEPADYAASVAAVFVVWMPNTGGVGLASRPARSWSSMTSWWSMVCQCTSRPHPAEMSLTRSLLPHAHLLAGRQGKNYKQSRAPHHSRGHGLTYRWFAPAANDPQPTCCLSGAIAEIICGRSTFPRITSPTP